MQKTDQFMTYSGMQVKHRKRAVLHGQRSGNNWSKKDGTASTELIIQGSPVPTFSNTQPYTYLGHAINLSATDEEDEVGIIVQDFLSTLEKIHIASMSIAAKLQLNCKQ